MFGQKRKHVASMMPLPPKLLIGLVVVCVVTAVFLLPTQETLLERQLRDEEWSKALATLRGLPPTERAARPEYYDLVELRLRRLELAPDDREGFTALLADGVTTAAGHDFTAEFVREIELLAEKSLSAKETHRLLAPHLDQLPAATRDQLRETLAKRALAEAEPLLALEIYEEYWRWHANDPEVVFHYINLARGAGKPTYALHALSHYEKGLNEPLLKNNRQLAILRIQLLRETNQPELAFAETQKLYAASDEETRRELYALLNETAVHSGNSAKLLDEKLRRAEAALDDAPRWRELASLAAAAGRQELAIRALEHIVRIAPKDGESAFKLAQFYEWTGRPNDAFDVYQLAEQRGQPQALGRLLALNPGLYRDVELAAAVRKARDRIDLEEYGHAMARLFANLNEFDTAREYYRDLLKLRGEHAELLVEYGLLELDLGNLDAALALYSRAAKAAPENEDIVISIAEAQFRAGQFDQALATYRRLLQRHPSRRQLQNYLRLAESMGRIKDAAKVLGDYMAKADDIERPDYEKLAYFYGILGRRADLEKLLERAVALFPEDDRLRRQLLYAYSDNQKSAAAAGVLEGFPNLTTDPELAQFYIHLLSDAKRHRDVEHFVTERLSPDLVEQLKLHQLLASIYYETGNTNAARELYGRLHREDPANPEIAMTYLQFLLDAGQRAEAKRILTTLPVLEEPHALKLAAQLHAADREFKEALHYQRRYLASEPPDAGRDWGFLGDLLDQRGSRADAHRAYRRAVTEMLATISRSPQTNTNHAPIINN